MIVLMTDKDGVKQRRHIKAKNYNPDIHEVDYFSIRTMYCDKLETYIRGKE